MKSSFTVFGFTLYPYTLLMVLGAGVCIGMYVFLTVRRHRDCQRENEFAIEMLLIAMAAALPVAILFDALFKWGETGEFALSGATFYGGLLGALALWPILLNLKRRRKVAIYDRLCDLAPCIPAGHWLGRIGCFFGGCCYGSPTGSTYGVVFPEGSLPYEAYGPTPLHPTQLYEAIFLILLFLVLFFWGKRAAFPLYLMLYGVGRFIVECFRADDRGTIFSLPLSPAQLISILLILLGEILLVIRLANDLREAQK